MIQVDRREMEQGKWWKQSVTEKNGPRYYFSKIEMEATFGKMKWKMKAKEWVC